MKIRGFLAIRILACAMFIGGIACGTAVRGDELKAPLVVESNEPSVSMTSHNEPFKEAAPPSEQQSNLQGEAECKDNLPRKYAWPPPGLVAQALGNPATIDDRLLDEIINCEPRTLSGQDQMKNKLLERTRRLIYITRELNKSDDQYSRLYEEREELRLHIALLEGMIDAYRTELNNSKDMLQRADVIIHERNAYLNDLYIQMASQQVDDETRGAIVGVSVTFKATFAEFERIFGGPRPPGTSLSETVKTNWLTFGTLADMGRFGNKIIMVRHALYRGMPEDLNTLKSLTISIIEPQSKAQHAISLEGLREFPDLDLVVLDAPSSLEAKPLPLGSIDSYRTSLVSHVYPGENATIYSQLVQVRPIPNDMVFPPSEKLENASVNFMRVSGRISNGDSGGPLVLKENGERKVIGFVTRRVLGEDGGGIAVKASRLLDKFEELEFQRPQ